MLTPLPDRAPEREGAVLSRWGYAAIAVVLCISVLNWVGWAANIDLVTQRSAMWPHMPPWSGVIQSVLGLAILVQIGRPSPARVVAGCALAAVAGLISAVFLAEHLTGRSFGLDLAFFAEAVRAAESPWPGRPWLWTVSSTLLLAFAVGLGGLDRGWSRVVRPLFLAVAVAMPSITALAYAFEGLLLLGGARSGGRAVASVGSILSVLLLVVATVLTRPDRNPIAWILARPDRRALLRLVGILAGLPIVVGLTRLALLNGGLRGDAAWVVPITVGTVIVGLAVFFASQREQQMLIEKETLSAERAQAESKRAEAVVARAEAEARYRLLADNSVDVIIHHRGRDIVWVSPSVEAAFGWPREHWLGTEFLRHIHPDDIDIMSATLDEIAAGRSITARVRVAAADGGCHWVEGRAKPYIDHQGNADGVIAALRIIDDQVEAERERAEAETRYRILADNSVDIVSHLRDGEIVWVSPSAEAAFGWPPEAWIGVDFVGRIHPDDRDVVLAALQKLSEGGSTLTRFRLATVDGSYHWVESHAKPYIDANGHPDGTITSSRIIDDRVEAEQRLDRLARIDSVTGLVNRAETMSRLESSLAESRDPGSGIGVLFCDIDHFKSVNDTWGHGIGDLVLSTVAGRIRECIRQGDTVGRTGGDELLVLLPGLHSLEDATQIAEKIRGRAAEPIRHGADTIHTTVSIGATLAVPGECVTTTVARADHAMYQAKRDGRNTVIGV